MAPVRDGRRQLKGGPPRDGNPPFLPELEGLEAQATPTQAIVQVPPPASVQATVPLPPGVMYTAPSAVPAPAGPAGPAAGPARPAAPAGPGPM